MLRKIVCVCVCVCVRERVRWREKETDKGLQRGTRQVLTQSNTALAHMHPSK